MKGTIDLIVGLLGVLFIGLKLTGFINWSWWFVTIPFWLPVAIIISLIVGLYFSEH